jgi:tRNA A-37 threonylcarbamoyl transferase component Bud32
MKLDTIIAKREHKIIYRDGNVVIKLFDKNFSKADILNEALNQARVEDTQLNIPKILEVTKIDGNWAICMEYIEGKTLTQLINENPEKKYEYIDMLVDLQMKVHQQQSPLLTNLRDKMYRKISQTKFNATIRYELHSWLEGMPKHNKVCHGDFRPSNIIITPEGKPYIIDWAHVTQGNASADVARTYLLYLLADQKTEGDYYLKKFCDRSDTPKQYVEKWIPIVAASQSVKGNPEEVEFLTRMVDVKDYE